ncbi:MAG: HAMP domain-containing histidine kinase [Saprospiraceae bacterium]|nr:HAMP domain-containing histidine kinase [Saprospiraceae bacterium]
MILNNIMGHRLRYLFILVFIFSIIFSHAQDVGVFIDSLESRILCNDKNLLQTGKDIATLEMVFLSYQPNRYGEFADKLVKIFELTKDQNLLAEYYLIQGAKSFGNNQFSDSYKNAQLAAELSTRLQDTAIIVRSYALLGALNNASFSGNESGDINKAMDYTLLGYQLATKTNISIIRSIGIQNYAFALMQKGDFKQASQLLNRGIQIEPNGSIKILDKIMRFHLYNLSGVCHREMHNFKDSKVNFEKAKSIAQGSSMKALMYLVYINMGIDAIFRNELDEAELYFLKAFQLKDLIAKNKIPILLKHLQNLYERKNDHKSALAFSKEYSSLRDEINSAEKNRTFIELQLKYNTLKNEINKLNLENEKIKLSKSKSVFVIYLLIILAIVLIMSALNVWKSRKALNEVIKKKELLYSMISHDLRGPVISMQQVMPIIIDAINFKSMDKVKMLLQSFQHNVINMHNLIENLFNIAKINREDNSVNIEEFNIYNEFNNLEVSFSSKITQKDLHLTLVCERNLILKTDRMILLSGIRNLLHNAIKFSYAGGSIIVKIENQNKVCNISITDFGLGIDDETKKGLFNSLITKSKMGVDEAAGSGVGLEVSQKLIRLVGGDLTYLDTIEGTTFLIIIPQ